MKTLLEVQQFCIQISPTLASLQEAINSHIAGLELEKFEQLCTLPEEERLAIAESLINITEKGSDLWLSLDKARRAFDQANSFMKFHKDRKSTPTWNKEDKNTQAPASITKSIAILEDAEESLSDEQVAMMIKLLKARVTK